MPIGLLPDPLSEPIAFLITYFATEAGANPAAAVLKVAFLCSLIAFPLVLFCDFAVRKKLSKQKPLMKLVAGTALGVFAFWIIFKVAWRAAFAKPISISADDFSAIAEWFVIALAFSTLGSALFLKMAKHWKMPRPITLYITTLVACVVFAFLAWIGLVLSYSQA